MKEIYESAIRHFGETHQILKCVSELAELQKELVAHIQNPHDFAVTLKIYEEMADVENMLEQLKIIFKCHEHVAQQKEIKMQRTMEIINRG